jgi:hypothetical protein
MSSKTIIIYQNKILFNILNELYSNEFSIIFTEKKNFDNLGLEKINNYLIITSEDNLSFKNQLIIKDFPLKITKILELFNIGFLKNNYKIQSDIKIGSYILNLNSKEISFDNKKLFLTERESNLILFLKKSNIPVNINKLQKEVWGYVSELETHTVETHIYRLRKKIKETFNDGNFINSTKSGYELN